MHRTHAHASVTASCHGCSRSFVSPCRTCLPSSIVHDAADALPPEAFVSACILPGVLLLCRRRAWGQRICSDETTAFRWSGHNRAAARKQGIQSSAWAGRALPQPPLPPGPAGTINARKSQSFMSISETETNFSSKDPDSCKVKL